MRVSVLALRPGGLALLLVALLAASGRAQSDYQLLKSFGDGQPRGVLPHAGLLLGQEGALYGTTELGGAANRGLIFRLQPDGSSCSVLHDFSSGEGKSPIGALVQLADGWLYGTTVLGGTNGYGTVYKVNTNGSGFAVLHHFASVATDTQYPYGRLFLATNNALYGVAVGTTVPNGCLYSLQADGTAFKRVYSFTGSGFATGAVQGQNGLLYGNFQPFSSVNGSGSATLFRLKTDGTSFATLTNLPASGRKAHQNGLLQASDGWLYGTTCYATNAEVLFKVNTNGLGYTVLHTFLPGSGDGLHPDTSLLQGLDGQLYGITLGGGLYGAGTVFTLATDGSAYTLLHSFQTNGVDGRCPMDSLIQRADGRLFGTTFQGGPNDEGTVYALNPDGSNYAVLYSFSHAAPDGLMPLGGLSDGQDGYVYGTTAQGGTNQGGTLYRVATDGHAAERWHDFGGPGDGTLPSGQLLRGAAGLWFGTTIQGGTNQNGTLFTLSDQGSGYQVLHHFNSALEGEAPSDALLQATNGWLYGTTSWGGPVGGGAVYGFDPVNAQLSILHAFATNSAADGCAPAGGLLAPGDGFLYGTTEQGGPANAGTLFRVAFDGSGFALLHSFATNGTDGWLPAPGLWRGQDGALYGLTTAGGMAGLGTAFKLQPDGSQYSVLAQFSATAQTGGQPMGGLVASPAGTLYGLAYQGGSTNFRGGVLFELAPNAPGLALGHVFGTNSADGLNPSGPLLALSGGGFCGVTEAGGAGGGGTVFRVDHFAPAIIGQPVSQFVAPGQAAQFNAVVLNGPAAYQWYWNGRALGDTNSAVLTVPDVSRTNAGYYSLWVTNAYGSVWSSNAYLGLQVPMCFSGLQDAGSAAPTLQAAYLDGWPVSAQDLSRFEVQTSSNLLSWTVLTGGVQTSNGVLVLRDLAATNQPIRFYRLVEHF